MLIHRQGDYIAYSDQVGTYPDGIKIQSQVYNIGDSFNVPSTGIGQGTVENNRAYAVTATTANSKF